MEFGIKNIIFILVFGAAIALFTKNALRLISFLKLAKPDNKRFENIGARIKQTFIIAIAQKKILRDKAAGPVHAGIFWGFLILLFAATNSIFSGFGFVDIFSFLGPIFSVITILTDIFIVLIMVLVLTAMYRRYILKVKRLQRDKHEAIEAGAILATIFSIVTSLMIENSAAIAMNADGGFAVRPVAEIIAMGISPESAPLIYNIFWWVHIILILSFMNYLPYSKHLHVLTSVINVYFSSLHIPNALDKIDFEEEGIEKFGVVDIQDFSWKTILDSYTCTECGRCTSVCPANVTGKVLDPREVMVQIRHRTMDVAPIMIKQKENPEVELTEAENEILNKKLIGDYVNPEALWQCTSCSACMQECPVNIEHVPAILGMRRSLVMMDAEFPPQLQLAFTNIENNSSPWAFPTSERADWAEGLGIEEAANKGEFDVLFWVGCVGSFDDRSKKISVAFSKLMQKAGIDFAILGREENCNGDAARRAGNEYLADGYVKMNIETMGQYKFNRIVATCPHCFNTLKNEYPQFGANYEVIHHTEFIDQLINEGKIQVSEETKKSLNVVYHDSCYIGRLNDIYEEPRNVLKGVKGLNVIDPARSKDKGFCCGAGGAQMFMEETEGKRVNIERTEELLATGAETIAVNCPFCMTMISDGVKAKEVDNVKVKDISEIILESIEG